MVAMAFARNWHLSWWEWHVLMLAAFALVAIGARISWYEERFAEAAPDQCRDTGYQRAVRRPQGFTTFPRATNPTRWRGCSMSTSR